MLRFGHIHKPTCPLEGTIVYPGSMISFGFDELGERGMLDVEIVKNEKEGKHEVKKSFIKLDERMFEETSLHISEVNSEEELVEKINRLYFEEKTMYKITLTGNKNFEVNINKIIKLISKENVLKIKNDTKLNQNLEKLVEEKTLKSFFVQEILCKFEKKEINEEIMKKIIEVGFEVL